MPIPPQIYLETQIRRLLPEVGNVTRAQLSREKWPGGIGHWAAAVLRAKEALASGDEQRMREAVPFCQALERDGGKVIAATKAKSLRRLGGKKRGQKQAADAAPFWKNAPEIRSTRDIPASAGSETLSLSWVPTISSATS